MRHLITIIVITFLASFLNAQRTTTNTNTNSGSLTISSTDDDDSYSYMARFDKAETENVKKVIVQTLGNANEETGSNHIWEGKGYSVILKQGKVFIEVDKRTVTKSQRLKLEDLGEEISNTLGSPEKPEPPTPPKTPKTPRR